MKSHIPASAAAMVMLDFDGLPCTLELANETTGAWREGLAIAFEHGSVTIELPAPFAAGTEARVVFDDGRGTHELPRENSWAFRRQADAFVTDTAQGAPPLASGADSVADIALAEAIWKRHAAA
jgi:predicted dehydrogenase